jgi:histidinol-phosphate aminotransferase
LLAALNAISGVRTYSSEANFILFRVPKATQIFEGLKQRGVLIKNLNGGHPALVDCLRVTVGAPDENKKFVAALQDTIKQLA